MMASEALIRFFDFQQVPFYFNHFNNIAFIHLRAFYKPGAPKLALYKNHTLGIGAVKPVFYSSFVADQTFPAGCNLFSAHFYYRAYHKSKKQKRSQCGGKYQAQGNRNKPSIEIKKHKPAQHERYYAAYSQYHRGVENVYCHQDQPQDQ